MSNMSNLYMDLHVIQTVPPSCLNRDDTGSPKTAIYGGTQRARVSSQAWKRAMRIFFQDLPTLDFVGYRTKNTVKLVAEEIRKNKPEIDEPAACAMATHMLELATAKKDSDKKNADFFNKNVLFFISNRQIESIALLAIDFAELTQTASKKESKALEKTYRANAEAALLDGPSIDILLFGRMAAGKPTLNYDASAQVAHSISTHTVSTEYDYFTAVDDFGEESNAGAGHLGTVEYNSSTLYRYSTVNLRELARHLTPDELVLAARGFAEAFIRSMPTGKQNTFANRTVPDLVYVTFRTDQPVNLAGAFEKPVPASSDGYVAKSIEALFEYASQVYEDYLASPSASWVIGSDTNAPAEKVNLATLLDNIEKTVSQYAVGGE